MSRVPKNHVSPPPSHTRSNRDLVMAIIGICLIVFFLVAAYLSLKESDATRRPKFRGPVRNPAGSHLLERGETPLAHSSRGCALKSKTPSDGLTGKSMPLPDGVSGDSPTYHTSAVFQKSDFRSNNGLSIP